VGLPGERGGRLRELLPVGDEGGSDLAPRLDELLGLADLGLQVRVGDLLGEAGQRLGVLGVLAGELRLLDGERVVLLGQVAIAGDDAPGFLAAGRPRRTDPAQRVERFRHVLDYQHAGGAGLRLLAFAGRADELPDAGDVALVLGALLQGEPREDAAGSQQQDGADDDRDHLGGQAAFRPLPAAHDVNAHRGLAQAQDVAIEQLAFLDPLAVQVDPVRGAEVADLDLAVDLADLGVPPGHGRVLHRDVALIGPADGHGQLPHRIGLLQSGWSLDDETGGYPVKARGVDHLGLRGGFLAHGY